MPSVPMFRGFWGRFRGRKVVLSEPYNLPAAQTKDLDWKAYRPGGGTSLYDAIGKGISKTNAQMNGR